MKSLIKAETRWGVAIREVDELVEIAVVDCEGRASTFSKSLREFGVDAIHYKGTPTNAEAKA